MNGSGGFGRIKVRCGKRIKTDPESLDANLMSLRVRELEVFL